MRFSGNDIFRVGDVISKITEPNDLKFLYVKNISYFCMN